MTDRVLFVICRADQGLIRQTALQVSVILAIWVM